MQSGFSSTPYRAKKEVTELEKIMKKLVNNADFQKESAKKMINKMSSEEIWDTASRLIN